MLEDPLESRTRNDLYLTSQQWFMRGYEKSPWAFHSFILWSKIPAEGWSALWQALFSNFTVHFRHGLFSRSVQHGHVAISRYDDTKILYINILFSSKSLFVRSQIQKQVAVNAGCVMIGLNESLIRVKSLVTFAQNTLI